MQDARQELANALLDGESKVREMALWAIGQLGAAGCSKAKAELLKLKPGSEVCMKDIGQAKKICDKVEQQGLAKNFQKARALGSSTAFRFTKSANMTMGSKSAKANAASAPVLQSALISCADDKLRHILRDMKDDDPDIRYTAVRIVWSFDVEKIAVPPKELAAHLVVVLEDPVEKVCSEAAHAFGKMSLASRSHLAHRMEVGNLSIRREAAQCLALSGTAAAPHLEVLQECSKDQDRQIRHSAAVALCEISGSDAEILNIVKAGGGDVAPAEEKVKPALRVRDGLTWRSKPGDDPLSDAYFNSVKRLQTSIMTMTSSSMFKW